MEKGRHRRATPKKGFSGRRCPIHPCVALHAGFSQDLQRMTGLPDRVADQWNRGFSVANE